MNEQVIDFEECGEMSCLRPPAGKGIDLRALGPVTVERTSEILFDEAAQMFYIKLLKDGTIVRRHWLLNTTNIVPTSHGISDTAFFRDYEDAVAAEIAYVRWLRDNFGPDIV